jgi:spore coat polysaccharide biosynthesis predicted glycosyltransferase SpsG
MLINPDIIINDRLDTSKEYMQQLKKQNYKVVNFEDLGIGCEEADVVINAIYPEKDVLPNHYFGHDYFVLRDEFILSELKAVKQDVKNILITFGGVDPNNYTEKVIRTINGYCSENNIKVTVIAGFGYEKYDTINEYSNVAVKQNVSNISDYMLKADLIFTSAGRTVYEVASIGTPAIVMEQNKREMTHFFASSEFGFSNLGLGYEVEDNDLFTEFIRLVDSFEIRKEMNELMLKQNLKLGRKRVRKIIQDLIQD